MKKFFDKIKNFCIKNPMGVILISLCLILVIVGTTMAIEKVRVGDMVKSYNPATGKVANKRVLRTYVGDTDELVKVSTSDSQQVISSPGHKFYANNSWVSAEDLRAGDVLVNVNGEKVIVEQVQHEILDDPVKVYNFEVTDNHTYFVGDNNGIAVHNKNCAPGAYKFKVEFKNGDSAWYVGKGSKTRMKVSMSLKKKIYKGEIIESHFVECIDDFHAFKLEAEWMNQLADDGCNLINKILSPGFKKAEVPISKNLREHLFKVWSKGVFK